jgi:hypothetical protein
VNSPKEPHCIEKVGSRRISDYEPVRLFRQQVRRCGMDNGKRAQFIGRSTDERLATGILMLSKMGDSAARAFSKNVPSISY